MNVSVSQSIRLTGGDGTLRPDEVVCSPNGGVSPAMTICIRCAFSCGGMSAEMTRAYRLRNSGEFYSRFSGKLQAMVFAIFHGCLSAICADAPKPCPNIRFFQLQ